MTRLGAVAAGAAGSVALDVALRDRAATHETWLGELGGQLTNV
jgi:hypothetical protein